MNEPTKDPRLTEALHQAYPAQTPGSDLESRLVHAERDARLREYRGGGLKKGWVVLLAAMAMLSVLGFTVYKIFFDRPGEAAITLIPADADIVITLDTNPSARQVATFARIARELEEQGILDKVDQFLTIFVDQNPVIRQIRPNVAKSLAMAAWMPPGGFDKGGEPDAAVFVALTSTGPVRDALDRSLPRDNSRGFAIYKLDEKGAAAIIGNYLVFAPSGAILARINAVSTGLPSVANLPEYKEARSSVAEDANLMVFLSPDAVAAMNKASRAGQFSQAKWLALGAAVRDGGIELTYRSPTPQSSLPALRQIAAIPPLDPNILRRLPDGAFGLVAYSQIDKFWNLLKEGVAEDPVARKDMERGLADFERKSGISVPRDIVPAFAGNMILAIYPDNSLGVQSADGVLMLDDSNGANPAKLAEKLRALIEREAAKQKQPARFISSQVEGATVWRLDPASQAQFTKGLRSSSPDGEGVAPPAMRDKTPIYATIGNSVILASSEAMLGKALNAYRGNGRSLLDDAAFATMQGKVGDRAQALVMVSLRRIMEAIRPSIEESGSPVNVDDLVNLFGGPDTGLVGTSWYDGNLMGGEMFVPLDWVRLVRIVGAGMRKDASGPPMGSERAVRMSWNAAKATQVLARL